MQKVFNKAARTFLIFAEDKKNSMKIPPLGTANVPDEFTGDVTFRKAVASGELVIWQEAKEVDQAQKALEKTAEKTRKPRKAAAEKEDAEKGET